MPRRISRDHAMALIEAEHAGACPLCGLTTREAELVVGQLGRAVAVLSRYPVRWGQVVVMLEEHLVSYHEVAESDWQDLSLLALRVARALEQLLEPARCYVTATGTSEEGLPMTTPHLHFNVIPVADPAERPKEVLTWSRGVMVAEEAEWQQLRQELAELLSTDV